MTILMSRSVINQWIANKKLLWNDDLVSERFYTLRPRQNGRYFADVFRYIFLNENARISLKISLKFVPGVRINNIPALVQITAWCYPGDKPLSEPMRVSLLTHKCVTRFHWVNNEPSHLNVLSFFSQALKHTYTPKQFVLSMIVPMLKGTIEILLMSQTVFQ